MKFVIFFMHHIRRFYMADEVRRSGHFWAGAGVSKNFLGPDLYRRDREPGWHSVVTRLRAVRLGFESRQGTTSTQALRPSHLPIQWVPWFVPRVVKLSGHEVIYLPLVQLTSGSTDFMSYADKNTNWYDVSGSSYRVLSSVLKALDCKRADDVAYSLIDIDCSTWYRHDGSTT